MGHPSHQQQQQQPDAAVGAGASRAALQQSSVVSESAVLIPPHSQPCADETGELDQLYGRISWRLIPLFLAVMVLNMVDRTNLAYASLSMNHDLGFGPAVYGLGSALFFLPFCVLQVPSNLAMLRVGARRWLAFLLLGWGVVACCQSLIHNVPSFFTLRVLLGVFEAGAVPCMWYQLSLFFPQERITKPFTFLTIGVLVAQAVGGPIAAGFLAMDELGGLQGWQWLFLLEGLPTVAMAGVVWMWLPDSPAAAKWLTDGQKKLHDADMARAASSTVTSQYEAFALPRAGSSVWRRLLLAVSNPLFAYICVLGLLLASAAHTYVFFLPLIINALVNGQGHPGGAPAGKGPSAGPGSAGPGGAGGHGGGQLSLVPVLLTVVPYTVGAVTSFVVATSSQKRQELYYHTAIPAFIGGVSFVLFPFLARLSVAAGFVALVFVALTGASAIGPKTAIVHRICEGRAQALAMPLYNSIITLGGFAGPFLTGVIVQRTGNYTRISVLFGIFLVVCSLGLIALKYLVAARDRRLARLVVACQHSHSAASGPGAAAAAAAAAAAGCSSSGGGGAAAGPLGGSGKDAGAACEDDTVVVVHQHHYHQQHQRGDAGGARPRTAALPAGGCAHAAGPDRL